MEHGTLLKSGRLCCSTVLVVREMAQLGEAKWPTGFEHTVPASVRAVLSVVCFVGMNPPKQRNQLCLDRLVRSFSTLYPPSRRDWHYHGQAPP